MQTPPPFLQRLRERSICARVLLAIAVVSGCEEDFAEPELFQYRDVSWHLTHIGGVATSFHANLPPVPYTITFGEGSGAMVSQCVMEAGVAEMSFFGWVESMDGEILRWLHEAPGQVPGPYPLFVLEADAICDDELTMRAGLQLQGEIELVPEATVAFDVQRFDLHTIRWFVPDTVELNGPGAVLDLAFDGSAAVADVVIMPAELVFRHYAPGDLSVLLHEVRVDATLRYQRHESIMEREEP